tara:strand:- start:608 stop:1105 length:498 start_codon:yes stop_codon:yes gene_type:complete
MAVKTNAQLAAFFETGDQPSQTEFGHLIDTIQPAPVFIEGDANLSLTVADHAFRTLIIDGSDADRVYTLPVPALGTWFHFVYIADLDAADNFDLAITNLAGDYLKGAVTHLDTDNEVAVIHANGSSHIGISLDLGAGADLWIMGFSSSLNYIWGNTTGATHATFI